MICEATVLVCAQDSVGASEAAIHVWEACLMEACNM